MDTIPSVEEAQRVIAALQAEAKTLDAEMASIKQRMAAIEARKNEIGGTWRLSGLLPVAQQTLERAKAAALWDRLPTAEYLPMFSETPQVGRLLKVTAKQIHILTRRGSDYVTIFSRETGKAGRGDGNDARILNLAEVLK